MRARSIGTWATLVAATAIASCGADQLDIAGSPGETSSAVTPMPAALTLSLAADRSIAALRVRFRVAPLARPDFQGRPTLAARSSLAVIGVGVATSFEPTGAGSVRVVVPREAKRGVLRPATVELPLRANAMARVEDDVTHLSVGFALRDAADAPLTVADGIARYPGALAGSDVVHRVHAEGTEDFVVFETRPAREELLYDVDVSRVAGLRLVSNTLEFLDEGGAPRLRVAPPYVVDTEGVRTEARVAVEGCAYDTDASGPWGRAVTRAGAARCGVRVAWSGAGYPLVVDPSWTATGSMAEARIRHTATLLPSGKVLVAGGYGAAFLSSAELFDGSAFAATGSMKTPRYDHTATLLPSGKVLVAGGYNSDSGGLSSAELFDGSASFASTGSMVTARSSHSATLLASGKVLVAGGAGVGGVLSSAEVFDGSSTFAVTGSMVTARSFHTATLLASGKVLVAGGMDNASSSLSSAELFDGSASFAPTGGMATARYSHTATLLVSGKVLVAGGYGKSFLSSAELFDGSASFAATGSMATARAYHTATPLGSGKVLIAGGGNDVAPYYLATAELFDGTGSFAFTSELVTARTYHTATRLPSGQVLVAGGESGKDIDLLTAELFAAPAAAGAPCAGTDDCLSGVCNDGRCCSGACAGACLTCDAQGACLAVTNAEDADTCGGKNTCDAKGACKKKVGQACPGGDGDCANGQCADGFCCDTACAGACDVCAAALGASADGACTSAPVASPGDPACGVGYACNGKSPTCPVSCVADEDCSDASYCAADGTCQARKAQAAACNQGAGVDCKVEGCRDCGSGHCVDGLCCDTACDGLCLTCAAALKQSGVKDGTCGPAKDQTNPHKDACTVEDPSTCKQDGQCDGKGACSLYYPPGTLCGSGASCSKDGETKASACDGAGTCKAPSPVPCGAYACGAAGCNTQCATDADCATESACDEPSGKCVSGAICGADGHTTTGANGTTSDCAPYNCESTGACKTTCGSVDDCASPNVCDSARHCVAPSETSGESGGCAVSAILRGGSPSRAPTLFFALGLTALAARRRRPRRA